MEHKFLFIHTPIHPHSQTSIHRVLRYAGIVRYGVAAASLTSTANGSVHNIVYEYSYVMSKKK